VSTSVPENWYVTRTPQVTSSCQLAYRRPLSQNGHCPITHHSNCYYVSWFIKHWLQARWWSGAPTAFVNQTQDVDECKNVNMNWRVIHMPFHEIQSGIFHIWNRRRSAIIMWHSRNKANRGRFLKPRMQRTDLYSWEESSC